MNTKKSIQVLNSLIEINNDRIAGYKTASTETKDNDLLDLFSHFTESSTQCKNELTAEVAQLGGTVAEGTPESEKFFRTWMDVKSALSSNDRKSVLSSCEYGEDKTLEAYNNVLTNDIDFLTIEQHKMIYKQYVMLKADHDKMKAIRDMELEHQH